METKRALRASLDRAAEIADEMPSGKDIAAGLAKISDEHAAMLEAVRAESRRLAGAIQLHPWWSTIAREDMSEARKALETAAATPM